LRGRLTDALENIRGLWDRLTGSTPDDESSDTSPSQPPGSPDPPAAAESGLGGETEENHPVDGYNTFSIGTGIFLGGRWQDPNDHGAGWGFHATIMGKDGKYVYAHLNEESVLNNGLSIGDEVKAGGYIGRIEEVESEWGNSSGSHVHISKLVWRQFPGPKDDGEWVYADPGNVSPLGEYANRTAVYGKLYDGGPNDTKARIHRGVDYAPPLQETMLK